MNNQLTINKYLPIAIIYFFFNSFLLPHGLLYTAILTPLLIIWLARFPSINYLLIFFLVSLPYAAIHLYNGVHVIYYLKSYFLLLSVFVFGLAFYQFLRVSESLSSIFKQILLINLFFMAVALVALLIPALRDRFWYVTEVTAGTGTLPRLKMLSYEPSYYSILFVPIVMYYYLKMTLLRLDNKAFVFLLITVPLLLSLSFGVIFGLVLAITFLFTSDIKLFSLKQRFPFYLLIGFGLLSIAVIIAIQFYPENLFFVRIANIFEGKDNSFRGRTFDSFYLGWKIAAQKSILFGAGPGQTKILGLELFNVFYNTTTIVESEVAIPNSVGDTLAVFGISGVFLRLGLQMYFFFVSRVYSNFYRLGLFLFVFIYQFTGSYLTNIAEYVIWILAFTPHIFKEFDKVLVYNANSRVVLNNNSGPQKQMS